MSKNLKFGLLAITFFFVAAVLFHLESQAVQDDEFTLWKQQHRQIYTSLEDTYRKIIFFNNINIIQKHNKDLQQSYKMGKGPFSALSQVEFEKLMLSPKIRNQQFPNTNIFISKVTMDVDWTTKGIISPVKFMGACTAGWAFSAIATIETLALIQNKTIIFSEQQVIDCSLAYGNLGCNDGDAYQALEFVKDHGIATLDEYPYIGKMQKCKAHNGTYKISAWHWVKGCPHLTETIQKNPVAVSVDATNWAHYKSGIFTNCQPDESINFDAYLVGATDAYWKLKNAWGTAWGEDGYIRIAHNRTCGMCVDKSTWVS